MTKMHLARWSARVVAQLNRTKQKKLAEGTPAPRKATPGKASGRWAILLLMGALMIVCSFNVFRQFVHNLGGELEFPSQQIEASDPFERMALRMVARKGTPFGDPRPWILPWPSAQHQDVMLVSLGLVLAALGVTIFLISLGYTNKDMAKVEWHMEWLWSLPVSGRTLFYGQLPGLVGSDGWTWLMIGPFLAIVYVSAGWGWLAIPLAILGTAYLSLLLCSLRLLTETVLRMNLGAGGLKNVQATFSIFGLSLYFGLMYFVFYPNGAGTLVEWGTAAPPVLLANPLSMPMILAEPMSASWVSALIGMALCGIAVPVASIHTAGWLVRGGLLGQSATHQGRRTVAGSRKPRPSILTGALGKEVRVLLRDRNLMVQVLVVPILFFGFYFVLMPGVKQFALASANTAAAVAFGFGAYALTVSAAFSLAFEGSALWLLYTFPHRLSSVLASKAALWSGLAMFYTLATLVGVVCLKPEIAADLAVPGAFALVGVPIMGVLAAGLGAMSTDPFQSDMQRRVNPELQFLYMFIAGVYGVGVGAPGIWPKVVMTTLAALAAFAVWQQVTDRLPYLLDPTEAPPRQITLVDGLVAALAFFGLQQIFMLIFLAAEVEIGPALVGAFSISGLLVVIFALVAFYSTKMQNIFANVGLRWTDVAGFSGLRAIGLGGSCGAAAALVGGVYLYALLQAIRHGWFGDQLSESALRAASGALGVWVIGLAVVAAPLFEEFIFRGLVFRGLRRSLPFAAAVVVSAAVFALVHPPVSVVPVFGLGLAAAFAYERTGSLLAPVLTHMVYNAAILGMAQFLFN
jgi:membrane protease YdiL (CAAX protease family)